MKTHTDIIQEHKELHKKVGLVADDVCTGWPFSNLLNIQSFHKHFKNLNLLFKRIPIICFAEIQLTDITKMTFPAETKGTYILLKNTKCLKNIKFKSLHLMYNNLLSQCTDSKNFNRSISAILFS